MIQKRSEDLWLFGCTMWRIKDRSAREHSFGERRNWSLLGRQSGLCGALCSRLASEVHGLFLFLSLTARCQRLFLYDCRAAFSPSWHSPPPPGTQLSPDTQNCPTVREWPTTSVTAPCAWWTTRVSLRRWLAWGCWGHCWAGAGAPHQPRGFQAALVTSNSVEAPYAMAACAHHVFLAQQWRSQLPEDALYFYLFYMFYWEFPTSDFTFCPSHSERQRERSFTPCCRVSSNLGEQGFFFLIN